MGGEVSKKHVLITLVGKSEPSPNVRVNNIIKLKDGAEPANLSLSDRLKLAFGMADLSSFVSADLYEHAEPKHEEKDCGDYTEADFKDKDGKKFVRRSWKSSRNKTCYNPENEGNILAFCREKKPDLVFMFPTGAENIDSRSEQTVSNAEHVRDILKELYPDMKCHILPLNVGSVKDAKGAYSLFRERFREMRGILKREAELGDDDCSFSLITSVGAPDMRTAVKEYIGTSGVTPIFYSILLPQDAKDGCRVESVPQDIENAAELLTDMDDDIKSCNFDVLAKNMKAISNLSVLEDRRGLAKIFVNIFKAYSDMERMDYKAAFEKINGGLQAFEDFMKNADSMSEDFLRLASGITEVLKRQKDYLCELRGNDVGENVRNLIDLYYNIDRAYVRGNYADVLSRFWRLREGILYLRLYCRGVNMRRIDRTDSNVIKIMNSSYGKYNNKKITIKKNNDGSERFEGNIDLVIEILKQLGDSDLIKFEDHYKQKGDKLLTLKNNRNNTIVAHGMQPVSSGDAQACRDIGRNMIESFGLIDGGQQALNDYPFKLDDLQIFSEVLKKV